MEKYNELSLAKIKSMILQGNPFTFYDSIVCHPENAKLIKDQCEKIYDYSYIRPICGLRIIEDRNVQRYSKKWEFPKERFVEYEKSDEAWAIPLGFGKWVESNDPIYFMISNNHKIYSSYQPQTKLFTGFQGVVYNV